jgi:hypothetical protein
MAKAKTQAGKTPSDRTAARRAELTAKGHKQKNLLLPPLALKALETITARDGISETEAVTRALDAYAKPNTEPSDAELIGMLRRRLAEAR